MRSNLSLMRNHAAFLLLVFLFSCTGVKPFPRDDQKTAGRWLEIETGSFYGSSRCVVTGKEVVNEYYERANLGRYEGTHLIKEQSRLQLSPENARWFWEYVDHAQIFDWSDDDMPPSTNHPTLTYRKDEKEIHLSSQGKIVSAAKFFELTKQIGELEERAKSERHHPRQRR